MDTSWRVRSWPSTSVLSGSSGDKHEEWRAIVLSSIWVTEHAFGLSATTSSLHATNGAVQLFFKGAFLLLVTNLRIVMRYQH